MLSAFKGWENNFIMQNSGSLLGLSAPGVTRLLCLCLSCSGDKEAEGILSEVGHGGARRHQRRSLQHEDPPGPAKRYDPLTCPTGLIHRHLCSGSDPSGSVSWNMMDLTDCSGGGFVTFGGRVSNSVRPLL